ncbi:hypothetical protein U1Q18_007032 [Sarracenia purpurea var. burkii]
MGFALWFFSVVSRNRCHRSRVSATCRRVAWPPFWGGEWNYHPANGTVDIAYRYAGLDSSAWVARRGTIQALAWNGFINWRFEIGGLRMKKKNSSLMEGFIRLFQSETVHS